MCVFRMTVENPLYRRSERQFNQDQITHCIVTYTAGMY